MTYPYFFKQKRYHTWNEELHERFGGKVFKVPLDGGFTCPNRDGHVAVGGCTFCSATGSGDLILEPREALPEQFSAEVAAMHQKWPYAEQYLVYFQNFTNTYAPVSVLRERFEQVLALPGVVGINIGTRPDCLPPETIAYLKELNERFYLWVELGLQTTFAATSRQINRGHDYETYLKGVAALRKANIRVCTHLINGLPGETPEMMVENVKRTIRDSDIQGIKLHLMHLLKHTAISQDYRAGKLQLLDQKTYVAVICDQLELLPREVIVHRLTGDAPWDQLIGPCWSLKKWEVLNAIDREMARRETFQGAKALRRKK